MHFNLRSLSLSLLLASLVKGSELAPLQKKDICIEAGAEYIKVYITTQVRNVPQLINTFVPVVPAGGVINVGGVNIVINNAPTNIVTVINVPSTQTVTQTATVTRAPNGNQVEIAPVINIINFPVIISTFVQQNTIINNNGATIIVTNAPTTIITTATGTSTVTETTTSTVTTTPTTEATVILSAAAVPTPAAKRVRRQVAVSGFLSQDGTLSQSCDGAARLVIDDGRLFAADSALQYTADANDSSIVFAPSFIVGSVERTFSSEGGLSWRNTLFTGGQAVFYIFGGSVRAQLRGAPAGPLLSFAAIPASACQNGNITTSSSTTMMTSTTMNMTSTSMMSTTTTLPTTFTLPTSLTSVSTSLSSISTSLSSLSTTLASSTSVTLSSTSVTSASSTTLTV